MISGGVNADDVKQKKCPPPTLESSDDNVSSATEKGNCHKGALTVEGGYEERVMPMFEGYVLSLKGHFNREVGVLCTGLQSATTCIWQLETAVTTEFENIKKLIKGLGYNDEEPPIGGGRPYRQYSPYRGADHDGTASAHLYAASTASPGVSKSGEDNVQLPSDIGSMQTQGHRVLSPDPPRPSVPHTEFSDSAPFDVDSHGGPSGDKDTESMGPVPSNIEPPPTQSTGRIDHVVVEPMETHTHDSHAAPPQLLSESNTVPDVSGVVNQILFDAGIRKELPHPSTLLGDVVGGHCQSSKFDRLSLTFSHLLCLPMWLQHEFPHPSPAPANVAAGPSVSSKFVPLNEKGAGDVPAADNAAGDGARRVSKRKHNSPQRLPSVQKKTTNASSNPTSPTRVLPAFIGGFNAFAPPTQANRDAFLKRLTAAKLVDVSSGSGYSISSLGPLFHCNGVCSHEALDRVVNLIRDRHDRLPFARFEFVPPSFFLELMRNYAGFDAIKEKHKFAFSTPLKLQFMHRPGWYTQVDFIYDELPPFPISRIEVPVLLEHPGFSGVASLILLEMAAADQPLNSLSLTEEEVRVAAENYAIAALCMG
ncbi:hypothetical protein Bca52824_047597 [Brassica carinata]|uniref:Uncharacterized protein n=1 Tax=Brassica carinata TaxID=52824 RepID=A0A8X7REZ0_BRACI|nr:hypothetical protein Bca52824_047597 [Brassica carinata]